MQQVLDMIADHTGWKASFICGGPEPADEGRLNIIRYILIFILAALADAH